MTTAAGVTSGASEHTLWKSLRHAIEEENYTAVGQYATQLQQLQSQADQEAFECRMLAHLYLNEYEEAIQIYNTHKQQSKSSNDTSLFYLAYAYYRNKQPELALETLTPISSSPIGQSPEYHHLHAQILYRLNEFKQASLIYKEHSSKELLLDDVEFTANLLATYIDGRQFSEAQALIQECNLASPSTYEIAYNIACSYVNQEKWEDANNYLDIAIQLCAETFKEDGDKVIAKESAVMNVQKAYILHKTKQPQAAYDLYTEMLTYLSKDSANAIIARENIELLTKDFPDLKIVASLNHSVEPKRKRPAPSSTKSTDGSSQQTKASTKKKKKRNTRFPKGYDPANPGPMPDPERWLPKWERTSYKKKNRKLDIMRGSQGSSAASPAASSSRSIQGTGASSPKSESKDSKATSQAAAAPARPTPPTAVNAGGAAAAAAARKKQKRKGRK